LTCSDSLRILTNMTQLIDVDLVIAFASLEPLGNLQKLKQLTLRIRYTKTLPTMSLTPLAGLSALRGLRLLHVAAGVKKEIADVSPIASLLNLTELDLGAIELSPEDRVSLSGLPKLDSESRQRLSPAS